MFIIYYIMKFYFKRQKYFTEKWEENLEKISGTEEIDIDLSKLINLIKLQMDIIYKDGKIPNKIYIGTKLFAELTNQICEHKYYIQCIPSINYLFNLEIIILPYFNGILVTPR